jgi:Zn-dependent M28 family amino/carboxypeptidase
MAEVQSATSMAHPIKNIVGRRGAGHGRTILGAHYDTRLVADQDPDPAKRLDPVPGANDGASGVAVLLELARTLPTDILDVELVFFDAEDNGYIDGWDWVLGSRAFVTSLATTPDAMILVDMVGDTDLRLPREANSDAALTASIWGVANRLGHGEIFIDEMGPAILDDHVPFLEAGIPAVDIIDFDYDYWHTTQDTPDKVSAESLEIVGSTILEWLKQEEPR